MTTSQDMNACTRRCWIAAVVIGVVVLLIMMLAAGWGFWGALVLGLVVFAICGIALPRLFCPAHAAENQSFAPASTAASTPARAPAPKAEPEPAPEPEPESEPEPEPEPVPESAPESAAESEPAAAPASPAVAAEPASAGGVVRTGTMLSGEAELAQRKGSWRYEPGGAAATAAAPASAAAPEEAQAGSKPAALDGPRGGVADNLKQIKGVGPKLESVLNGFGIYHFDQIAAWSPDEVAWADENLVGFKGRVSRDKWVEQARTLAEGGETEFSKRVDKGEVY